MLLGLLVFIRIGDNNNTPKKIMKSEFITFIVNKNWFV